MGTAVINAVRSGASTYQVFQNGTSRISTTPGTFTVGGMGLWGTLTGGSQYTGTFLEGFTFPTALSDADLAAVISWLNTKWAIY